MKIKRLIFCKDKGICLFLHKLIQKLWHTKLILTSALLVALASANAPLALFLKVTVTKLTLMSASTAVLAPMHVLPGQLLLKNNG